jgi:hypothetical protein
MVLSPIDEKLVGVISKTLENAPIILSAFNHVGRDQSVGFTLAVCCAMAQKESGGRMIWGADSWNKAAFPRGAALDPASDEQPVTQANYHVCKARRDGGMQPQRCGITQLTTASLQIQAETAGGCACRPGTRSWASKRSGRCSRTEEASTLVSEATTGRVRRPTHAPCRRTHRGMVVRINRALA